MIQRIQTLYLLIAIIVAFVGIYFVLGHSLAIAEIQIEPNLLFNNIEIGLFLVSALISMGTIFAFKNRTLQLNLGKLNILINLLLLGLSMYPLLTLSGEILFSEKGIGVVVPSFVILVLVLLANRAIKKDENLVKSVDRLR